MNKIKMGLVVLASGMVITSAQAQTTVTLDYFYNHEFRKTADGKMERFHYMWDETDNNGFSIWGDIFKKYGAQLSTLETAPTAENLRSTDIYIVVDPDNKKETASPNYFETSQVKVITDWVKAGGVLVIMANDSTNVNLPSANNLAEAFGLHFNDDLQNHVIGENFAMGALIIPPNDPIFKTAKKVYLKDISSIKLSGKAKPAYTKDGAVLFATVKYGKGTVFAVGDPWLYNEYTNGRLPADYENNKAANDLSKWLIMQARVK